MNNLTEEGGGAGMGFVDRKPGKVISFEMKIRNIFNKIFLCKRS